jgi:hypothetical protein
MKSYLQFISEATYVVVPHQPWNDAVGTTNAQRIDAAKQVYADAYDIAIKAKPHLDAILKRAASGAFIDKVVLRNKPASQIKDLLRGAVLMKTEDEVNDAVDRLLRTQKIVEYEKKNRGEDKTFGYYGSHHFTILIDSLMVEVQVMTQRLWSYKEWGHEIYTQYRSSGGPDLKGMRMSKQIFDKGNHSPQTFKRAGIDRW